MKDVITGYVSFIESMPVPAMLSALDNHIILSANRWASELLKVPQNRVSEEKYSDLFEAPHAYARFIKDIKRNGQIKDHMANLKTYTGEPLQVFISAGTISLGGRKIVVSAMKDAKLLRLADEELRLTKIKLEEVNTALKVLLRQRDLDKKELEETVLINVKEMVLPHMEKLKRVFSNSEQRSCLEALEESLKNIVSPFIQSLTSISMNLTPTEIKVACYIRDGKSIKEISKILAVSESAVNTHRQHVRNKLGLNGRKTNLRAYLITLQSR